LHNKLAHTAEHAFIGSLQKLTGKALKVIKVEHRGYDNLVVIPATGLGMSTMIEAERYVNSLISQGRRIIIHSFGSLAEAKSRIPNLRANEYRIANNNPVRVVEIEDLDIAACIMDHTANLRECGFFLITHVNKIGSDYEITFVVSEAAKNTAIDLSSKILNICRETGANYNTVEETVRKLSHANVLYLERLKKLTEEILNNAKSRPIGIEGASLLSGTFVGLLDDQVREFASRKIAESNIVVVLVNLNSDLDSTANVVFARNELLINIDCTRIFKEIASEWGKGGGNSNFVTGVIRRDNVEKFINTIASTIEAD
jgi:alanyl-tRNA synthetase